MQRILRLAAAALLAPLAACEHVGEAPEFLVTPAAVAFDAITPKGAAIDLSFTGSVALRSQFIGTLIASPSTASVIWTTDDASVAIVDANGVVTAQGNGTTTVRARLGTKTTAVPVTVRQLPASMQLGPTETDVPTGGSPRFPIVLGQTVQNAAVVRDRLGSVIADATISWQSLTPSVVTVNNTGQVTGVGRGVGSIAVRSGTIFRELVFSVQ